MKIPFLSPSDPPEVDPDAFGPDDYDVAENDDADYEPTEYEGEYGDAEYEGEYDPAEYESDYDGVDGGDVAPDEDDVFVGADIGDERGNGIGRRPRIGRRGPTIDGDGVDVSVDEFLGEMEQWRSEPSTEQRSAWAYLGLLTVVFCSLVIFGYGCSDRRGADPVANDQGVMVASGEPTHLVFRVDGDIITLQGEVPDDGAKDQLLSRAQSSYGVENVIDELVINAETTFEAGTIRLIGSAAFNDDRPEALQEAVSTAFGLANRGFEVGFVDTVLTPVSAQMAVDDLRVSLSGSLPDQQSVDDLVAVAAEVWGAENVDSTALTIGETTWTDGLIRLTGTALSADQRIATFVALVPERIGALVTVDTAAVTINDVSQLLDTVQIAINDLIVANPIQFAPLSADIEPDSDSTLVEVADLVSQLPSTSFEVVGHTDSVGDDQENLLLSQDRAQAVVDRLVELGVAVERMTSRGEGESKPIADESTEAGKAANRRIEFVLVGTSSSVDLTDSDG